MLKEFELVEAKIPLRMKYDFIPDIIDSFMKSGSRSSKINIDMDDMKGLAFGLRKAIAFGSYPIKVHLTMGVIYLVRTEEV
jgi:hypothetical protein